MEFSREPPRQRILDMAQPPENHLQSGSPNEPQPPSAMPFHEILEQVEHLSGEDQDALIDLIKRRRVEARRQEIAENIRKSKEEFEAGLARRGTIDQLMEEFGR
jgi:hypothetical protein